MSEKIDPAPAVLPPVTPPQGKGVGSVAPPKPPQQSFADLLAEAEAVQDAVHLSRAHQAAGRAFPHATQPGGATPLWWGPNWSRLVPWAEGQLRSAPPGDPEPPDEGDA